MAFPLNPPVTSFATFAGLQIHPSVLPAIADVAYVSPSAIRAATIPTLIAGSDVVGLAQRPDRPPQRDGTKSRRKRAG